MPASVRAELDRLDPANVVIVGGPLALGHEVRTDEREVVRAGLRGHLAVDGDQATVIRAKVNPEGLARFARDPKVLGISLGRNR